MTSPQICAINEVTAVTLYAHRLGNGGLPRPRSALWHGVVRARGLMCQHRAA